jgi:hypothetical protein
MPGIIVAVAKREKGKGKAGRKRGPRNNLWGRRKEGRKEERKKGRKKEKAGGKGRCGNLHP